MGPARHVILDDIPGGVTVTVTVDAKMASQLRLQAGDPVPRCIEEVFSHGSMAAISRP